MPKNKCMLMITILLGLLFLFLFQKEVFAEDNIEGIINTKVVITGNWIDVDNKETIVILTNITTGKTYNGILGYNKQLIFKNIDYGEYEIRCENPLDRGFIGSDLENDKFTLSGDGINQVVQNITVTNILKSTKGFYNIAESNNLIKYLVEENEELYPLISVGKVANIAEIGGSISDVVDGVPIPAGFFYVGGTKSTGLIISDSEEDYNKGDGISIADTLVGNQFVWIPCIESVHLEINIDSGRSGESIRKYAVGEQDISYFQDNGIEFTGDTIDITSSGIYTIYTKNNKGNEAIATIEVFDDEIVNNFKRVNYKSDTISSTINTGYWEETDTVEYQALLTSVTKYGGYYIARYEAGIPNDLPTAQTTVGSRDVSGVPISKKNSIPWNNIGQENSVNNSKKMYQDSTSVVSHLLYGIEWDSSLEWLIRTDNKTRTQMADSRTWGNYGDATVTGVTIYSTNGGAAWNIVESRTKASGTLWLLKTGNTNFTVSNNIYDLAGNIAERTQERYSTSANRVVRGGEYVNTGSTYSVGSRYNAYTQTTTNNVLGYRVGLYIIDTSPIINLSQTTNETPTPEINDKISATVDGVPIPTGFYYVGGTKDTGLIISDSEEDYDKGESIDIADTLIGNQFVWVPANRTTVSINVNIGHNISDESVRKYAYGNQSVNYFSANGTILTGDTFEVTENGTYTVYIKNTNGKETVATIDVWAVDIKFYRENYKSDTISSTTNTGYWEETDTAEYQALLASVTKYGGYYIARYEAGIPDDLPTAQTTVGSRNVSGVPISKKNTIPWNNIGQENSVNNSKKMYENSTSVVSHLLYGIEWDSCLEWIIRTDNKTRAQMSDSRTWGNYGDATVTGVTIYSTNGGAAWNIVESRTKASGTLWILKTGNTNFTGANNIYDLAGNVCERTQERYGTSANRVVRGGEYVNTGSTYSVGSRYNAYTQTTTNNVIGYRVGLYITE